MELVVDHSIAKVICPEAKRNDGYTEGGGYVVTWCVGHLVELASPQDVITPHLSHLKITEITV